MSPDEQTPPDKPTHPGRHALPAVPADPMRRLRRGGRHRAGFTGVLRGWGFGAGALQGLNGTIETALSPHYPSLQQALHASAAQWGLVLTGISVGLFIGGPLGGRIAEKIGSRTTVLIGMFIFFGAPPFAGIAPNLVVLWLILVLLGFGNGLFDNGWGLQGTNFELLNRHDPRLKDANLGFQAVFSAGSVLGVGSAALAFALHWDTLVHMAGVSAIALIVGLWTVRNLPAAPERVDTPAEEDDEPVSSATGTFVVMCVGLFVVSFPIGAAYAYSTPFLQGEGAKSAVATVGLIAYTVCEGASRLIAQRWSVLHLYKRRTVVVGAVVALLGVVLIIGPGSLIPSIVGFALLSLGLGPAGPIIQSLSNRAAGLGRRARRNAWITTVGYSAGVIGQFVIGELRAASNLRVALMVLLLCPVVMLSVFWVVPRRAAGPRATPRSEGDEHR
jgi:MFS family permease